MARSGRVLCLVAAVAAVLHASWTFVPGPLRRQAVPLAASAAVLAPLPAFADGVDAAAKKLADASYPMVKAVDWATTDVLDKYMAKVPTTKEFSKAILDLSVSLDPKLVKDAVAAHKKAVDAMGPDFVTPLKNHEEVTVALAKMFAAAPKDKIKAVFDATPSVKDLNAAWYAQMPKADADATFVAFKELAEAVKAAPVTQVAPVAAPSMDGPIGMAAKKLADASYPMIKSLDWAGTGVLDKYVAKTPATKESIAAFLDAGLAMDPKLIQGATQAHLDALKEVDGKLVTSLKGHEEVTVAIAKLIASAPPATIKKVFDTVPNIQGLNADWFATMPMTDAIKSYQAFLETATAVAADLVAYKWFSEVVCCRILAVSFRAEEKLFVAMARSGRVLCLVAAVAAVLHASWTFVPGPLRRQAVPLAASAAVLAPLPAFADGVDTAAKKLADASYPMVKAVDWATTDVLDKYMAKVPTTKEFSKAILDLSVSLDPKLVKDAVAAHKKAVDAMGPDFVTPLKNHEEVTVALAKMFAAAPKDKIKAVFDATPSVKDLNAAWYAQMPKADADATFVAFKELAEAVKAAPVTQVAPVAAPSMDGPIGMAAKKLADASYPMIKSLDWAGTGVLDKYVAKTPATKESIAAFLDAGLAMDPKLIQGATQAHLDALKEVDGKLVTSLKGHEEVTVAIAKLIASAPPATIKKVFDTVPNIQGLNADWFATMPMTDAIKSYQAFLETATAVAADLVAYKLFSEVVCCRILAVSFRAEEKLFVAMARSGRVLCLVAAVAAVLHASWTFVPGPLRRQAVPLAASAAVLAPLPAFADGVDTAAKKLADASYPMVKAVDWATTDVLDKYMAKVPTTKEFSKAILDLSVSLDPKLVKDAVAAHKKAVDAMGPDFVTPLKNHEEVTVALAKMFAAAPKDKIKAVFDATPSVKDLNAAWYAQMPKADADATFVAFKELAEAVKAAPVTQVAPVAAPSMDGPIGMAAKKLADASYPMIKSLDWAGTGVLDKYVAKTPATKESIAAFLDAGLAMDPKLIQGATQAHLDALKEVDGKLVTSLKGHEEVTVAIAKLIASAPPATIKKVFDTVPNIQGLNADWFATMPMTDAIKSYQAFLETATAVAAAKR
ncbi:unnamed protein product [Symbiodinium sp. CCMP2592]|nr:unnamed protein product [Symbiodinium sp. CCMP2592]